jgi:hypothetical protein
MTSPAHVYDLGVAWKGCPVATVTGRTGRGVQVLLLQKSNAMYAFLKQFVLVSGNAVGLH